MEHLGINPAVGTHLCLQKFLNHCLLGENPCTQTLPLSVQDEDPQLIALKQDSGLKHL